MIKVLFLGEIIGITTIKKIANKLQDITDDLKIDLTIANADGVSDGYGILSDSAIKLNKSGIDIITCGDYVFNKKDAKRLMALPFLTRPYNISNIWGGQGINLISINEIRIGVINILGRVNFNKMFASDPFRAADQAINQIKDDVDMIIVDFHGGATSEIQGMQWHLAGKVSLVVGSHLRVLTSDNRIIMNKTAIVTGVGYCGGEFSVGGLKSDIELKKIKSGQFMYSKIETENTILQGVIVEIEEKTGNSKSIDLFNYRIDTKS